MFRILFQRRGIRVYSYTAMLYLGLVLGVIAGTTSARFHGLNPERVYIAMLLLFVPALLGARLLFVATHWEHYRNDFRRILRRSEGGAMMYGGLLLALAVSLPLLRALDLSVAGFWDIAAITILVGMVPGRFGCFLNGCCSGRATASKLSLVLPDEHGIWRRRIPTQMLEAVLAMLILALAISVQKRFPIEGVLFLTAATGYGIGRWWLESLRETTVKIGAWSLSRMISGAFVVFSAMSLIVIWLHRS